MIQSTGTLLYSNNPYKLIVSIDNEIGRYYRSLIPKYFNAQPQAYSSHISVVRKEIPPNINVWYKYHGSEIQFEYDSIIYNGEVYFWLNAYSPVLEEIRLELGLQNLSQYTRSPDGRHRFHITIANMKGK